jgi:alpha-L-rhamnosidase
MMSPAPQSRHNVLSLDFYGPIMRYACLLAALAGTLSAAPSGAAFQPQQLRCEYRVNPQGIDATQPRLSWILTAANAQSRGLHQTAYRILVASSPAFLGVNTGNLWDSGKVVSADSIHVEYAGKPLESGTAAFWKVQVWDQAGQASDWSAPAQWSMGLLQPQDWQGTWIGRDEAGLYKAPDSIYQALVHAHWIWDTDKAQSGAAAGNRYFRTSFNVPAGRRVKRAIAIVGADPECEFFFNGVRVAAPNRIAYPQDADITALVHPGANTIAVQAHHPAANTPAGLIAAVKIEFTSGEPLLFQSGNHWVAIVKPEGGWEKPGFLDSGWQAAKDLGEYGMAPWKEIGFITAHRLPARMLRKEFSVSKKIRRAAVYYAGLGLSELYLNGAKVGDHVLSPGLTDYDRRVLYVTFDVTSQLVNGANAVGLILGNGRYYAPRVQSGTRTFAYPKAKLQLNIEYEDGTRSSVVTDESWKLTTDGPIRGNNEYDGEDYDARREMPGWSKAGFDDSKWETAQSVALPTGELTAQMAEPLRITEALTPISVKQLKPGVFIFDLGQNMVGWCRLRVSGPKGTTVTMRHAETLNPDGSLYVANLRTARATDNYTLKGVGVEEWEPRFTYHGFRYVEVTGFPGVPTESAIEGHVVHDDMEQAGEFTSSSAMLNKIHRNMFWGIRGNYRSIPTDCPQRDERQGWLGDRGQVSRSESYMFDVAAFYEKWMNDLEDGQKANGSVSDVMPNYWPLYHDDLTWPGTLIFVHGMLYDQYADTRALARGYDSMKKWIDMEAGFVKDGLTSKDTYADWCVPPEDPKLIHSKDPARVTDKTLIASAYYFQLLRLMSRYARILDRDAEAAEFDRRADQVKDAFQRRYFRLESNMYDNGTQTSSVLPLYFDMVPADFRPAVVESLVRNIETKSASHVGTGLVGAQWLMRTLSDNGHAGLAYKIATQPTYPGWGYMVEQGATTVWELWNGNTADPSMNSGNHVMQIGDLAVWMYEYLAGMRTDPDRPGFRHSIIRPYPVAGLTSVKASHKTMYGALSSSWKHENGQFTLDVVIPANTTATVWVPAKDAATITESGKKIGEGRGVKRLRSQAGVAIFEVESGAYSFKSNW